MKNLYLQLKERFDAFNLRERLLLTAAMLLTLYVLFDSVALAGIHQRRTTVVAQLNALQQRNQTLDTKILELSQQVKQIQSQGSGEELEKLKNHLKTSNKKLDSLVVKFVKPSDMVQVLREVLKDVKGLKLMRVKSMGVVNLLDGIKDKSVAEHEAKYKQALRVLRLYQSHMQAPDQAELDGKVAKYLENKEKQDQANNELPQIYKHGILIELSGSYTATLQYLRMLEKLPWKFYWEAMRFEIDEYPNAKISIVINTLSLNKDWVRV